MAPRKKHTKECKPDEKLQSEGKETETQSEADDGMDLTKGEVIVRWLDGVPLRLLENPTFHDDHTFRYFCSYILPSFKQVVDAHFELRKYSVRREALVHEDGLDFLAVQRRAHDTGEPVIFSLDAIKISEHVPRPVTSLVGHPDLGECRWKVGNVTVIRRL